MIKLNYLHVPFVFTLLLIGCQSAPDYKPIDNPIQLKKPVETIKSNVSHIDKQTSNIQEFSNNIKMSTKSTKIYPEINPDLQNINLATNNIKKSSNNINTETDRLKNLQTIIDKRTDRIAKLKSELKKEKDKNKREVQHLWTWLQIGGMILVGIGIGIGFLIHRVTFGIAVAISGLGITLISRFLQLYEWILMLATGIIIIGIFVYLIYYAITHRNAFWRELKRKTQTPKGAEIKQELDNK